MNNPFDIRAHLLDGHAKRNRSDAMTKAEHDRGPGAKGQIGGGPYFFGERFTVLDIYVWMLAQWMPHDWLARECPKVKGISDAVAARPMIAPVHSYHFG